MEFVKRKGLEDAKAYFYPRDFTHTNDYGAYRMAGFIVRDYLEQVWSGANRSLGELMAERSDIWEGEAVLPTVPERYRDVPRPDSDIPLFVDLDRPKEPLTRAEALDMVIKAARFFPINVFNDLFEDIVGHEWYAGTVECAHQDGIILPQMLSGNRLEPEKPVTTEEFLALIMRGYSSRKKLPEDKPCVFDAVSQLYCIPYVRAACALGVIRDSDGTVLSDEITKAGYGIYSTICIIRDHNKWAEKNQDKLQQCFLMTHPSVAEGESLAIALMDGFFEEQFRVNDSADSMKYWQVYDRTTDTLAQLYSEFSGISDMGRDFHVQSHHEQLGEGTSDAD